MLIKEVHVRNFRCLQDCQMDFDQLTALVGRNGAGKSTVLTALVKFYNPAADYTPEDYYAGNTGEPISISVSFGDLTHAERDRLGGYTQGDTLTVEKLMEWPRSRSSQRYHGSRLRCADFHDFREAGGAGLRIAYNALRDEHGYNALPQYTNRDEAETALREWESNNPGSCERQPDDGQFFGFREVGQYNLEQDTKFLLVPAVRDASEEAGEQRGSAVAELMDLLVRSTLRQRRELLELQDEFRARYNVIVDPENLEEFQTLEVDLNRTLERYAPGTSLSLRWQETQDVELPMPRADVRLIEDEYPSKVERTGHGLQRAFILTVLERLALSGAVADAEGELNDEDDEVPSLIIAVEEPELYQHPNRQRHLSTTLRRLAYGEIPGVAASMQVMYSTHSPLFVGLDRFDEIRMLRKSTSQNDMPPTTRVVSTTLDRVARELGEAWGEDYSGTTLRPRLQALMTPWLREGFFADVAVLVEGEEDRAAIFGMASALGRSLEAIGISVIPCNGKTCLDRALLVLRQLGITTYVVWDSDSSKQQNPECNHALLRLHGCEVEDWPCAIQSRFACFRDTLATEIRSELGEANFERLLDSCKEQYQIARHKDALKTPAVMEDLISIALAEGLRCPTLERIVENVCALR